MRTYETVFVLSPELAPDGVSAQVEFYKDNIVKNGGEIILCDEWGKRELAYPIGAFREAFYTVIQFKAEPVYIAELERRYKFNELILRHVVMVIDEKRHKLKPRKDPVKRERRHERRPEGEQDISFSEAMTQTETVPAESVPVENPEASAAQETAAPVEQESAPTAAPVEQENTPTVAQETAADAQTTEPASETEQ